MFGMYLKFFTKDEDFPFYIHRGEHDAALFMHTHVDFTELTVVLNGSALHCVDSELYFIKRGDIFIINGGTGHGYRSPNNLKICNIMFRADKLFETESDIYKVPGFQELFFVNSCSGIFQSRLTLANNDFEKFYAILSAMLHEYDKKELGWKSALKANFISAAIMLSRAYNYPPDDSKVNEVNLDTAVSYIENRYTEQISISDLALMSYISERHFARTFKHSYKVTPGSYILDLRMQHACMLLKNTMRNISEISSVCGFNGANYFTRQFRSLYGITPREYRIQNQNNI